LAGCGFAGCGLAGCGLAVAGLAATAGLAAAGCLGGVVHRGVGSVFLRILRAACRRVVSVLNSTRACSAAAPTAPTAVARLARHVEVTLSGAPGVGLAASIATTLLTAVAARRDVGLERHQLQPRLGVGCPAGPIAV
jgi:hypothetical protein